MILFEKYNVYTDLFFQTFVIVKSKLTPGHKIVKFSCIFTRLGLRLLDPQHFDNVMMEFYHQKRTDDKEKTSVNVLT